MKKVKEALKAKNASDKEWSTVDDRPFAKPSRYRVVLGISRQMALSVVTFVTRT